MISPSAFGSVFTACNCGRMALAGVVEIGRSVVDIARNLIGIIILVGLALAKTFKLVA